MAGFVLVLAVKIWVLVDWQPQTSQTWGSSEKPLNRSPKVYTSGDCTPNTNFMTILSQRKYRG